MQCTLSPRCTFAHCCTLKLSILQEVSKQPARVLLHMQAGLMHPYNRILGVVQHSIPHRDELLKSTQTEVEHNERGEEDTRVQLHMKPGLTHPYNRTFV